MLVVSLNLQEIKTINELATLLYDFLPGSGNSRTAFPIAAAQASVPQFWIGGSKRPAIVELLSLTLERQRGSFRPLILAVVEQSISWRQGKDRPLTRDEVDTLNELLRRLTIPVPQLTESSFLASLSGSKTVATPPPTIIDAAKSSALAKVLIGLDTLNPQARGYSFESFLQRMFEAYSLSPRAAFRLVGEQIDGSFELNGETYLLEAKWENRLVGLSDLLVFANKVTGKAIWSRGLFVSYGGFSNDGLIAFCHGRPTSIICMDGFDLHEMLDRNLSFQEVISKKVRRAGETGKPLVHVRELFG